MKIYNFVLLKDIGVRGNIDESIIANEEINEWKHINNYNRDNGDLKSGQRLILIEIQFSTPRNPELTYYYTTADDMCKNSGAYPTYNFTGLEIAGLVHDGLIKTEEIEARTIIERSVWLKGLMK